MKLTSLFFSLVLAGCASTSINKSELAGQVLDAAGMPIVGARVISKNETVATDAKGEFRLTRESKNISVKFSDFVPSEFPASHLQIQRTIWLHRRRSDKDFMDLHTLRESDLTNRVRLLFISEPEVYRDMRMIRHAGLIEKPAVPLVDLEWLRPSVLKYLCINADPGILDLILEKVESIEEIRAGDRDVLYSMISSSLSAASTAKQWEFLQSGLRGKFGFLTKRSSQIALGLNSSEKAGSLLKQERERSPSDPGILRAFRLREQIMPLKEESDPLRVIKSVFPTVLAAESSANLKILSDELIGQTVRIIEVQLSHNTHMPRYLVTFRKDANGEWGLSGFQNILVY